MLFFALKRLASAVIVLFAVSVLTFLIFFAIPNGNPALRLAGRTARPQDIARVERIYGFDKPLWVQYWRVMKQIFNGSIQSYVQHTSVFGQIRRGLPATASLAIGGAILWLLVGVAFGVIGALRAGKATDVGITSFAFLGISAPSFVVGNILLFAFAYKIEIFPNTGYVGLTTDPVSWFQHMILPWITLALLYIGIYSQVLRSGVLDAMTADNVRTAYAKGLSPTRVLLRHVLRVSLIPIVSLWGLDFASVLGGSTIVVENVFNLNGVGQLVATSVNQLDVPPILVTTLLGAFFVVFMNAVVDIVYAFLDPRIRSST
ncbi:MAG: ABC transporter permease [Jatrophihabitans endophyticus]|nr:ABC transporter permease [Jatrophihabitans endophyticus]